jgi:hypothetical protein
MTLEHTEKMLDRQKDRALTYVRNLRRKAKGKKSGAELKAYLEAIDDVLACLNELP